MRVKSRVFSISTKCIYQNIRAHGCSRLASMKLNQDPKAVRDGSWITAARAEVWRRTKPNEDGACQGRLIGWLICQFCWEPEVCYDLVQRFSTGIKSMMESVLCQKNFAFFYTNLAFVGPLYLYRFFSGAAPFPSPYFLTSSLPAPLSASKALTSGLSMCLATLSACHFLKEKPRPLWL